MVQLLEPLTGLQRLPSIYGFTAAWLTLTLVSYPYVLIPVAATLRGLDPALEDAARSLGHGPVRDGGARGVAQLRPAIGAGALLVALYVLSDFGAVALSRYDTFTRAIFTSYKASFDRSGAAGLAVILVALTAVLVWFESRTRSRGALARGARSAGRVAQPRPLGRWRIPALLATLVLLGATVALPLGMLALWAGARGERRAAARRSGRRRRQLDGGGGPRSARRDGDRACRSRSCPGRSSGRHARFVEGAAYLGHALPGIVVALALVFLTLRAVPQLYQTLAASCSLSRSSTFRRRSRRSARRSCR